MNLRKNLSLAIRVKHIMRERFSLHDDKAEDTEIEARIRDGVGCVELLLGTHIRHFCSLSGTECQFNSCYYRRHADFTH